MNQPSPSPTDPPPRRRSGNPLGNPLLNQSPRCGARTRAGCPCRAPALRGKARCRLHGGASTGPRTEQGLARLRAARTVHGYFSAEQRARDRHMISSLRRSRMLIQVMHWLDDLPPALAERALEAPELYLTREPIGGLTLAQDRAILRQETAALAPWRAAVEAAKQAWREKKGKPCVPVSRVLGKRVAETDVRQAGGEPRVPVSPAAAAQAEARAPAATLGRRFRGDDGGRATGMYQNGGRPRVPVSLVLGKRAAETDVRQTRGEPYVPVSVVPPAGMTRAQRKRWKWEQRKARKLAMRDEGAVA